jgi:hypothetical protein
MKKETKKPTESDKKSMLSFFLIAFPTLLIIISMMIFPDTGYLIALALAIYQFVVLKQFIDEYYKQFY